MKSLNALPGRLLVALAPLLLVTGCDKPVKAARSSNPPEIAVEPEIEEQEVETPVESDAFIPLAETKKLPPDQKPEPPDEVDPILDVRISRDKILITGHLQSEYQHRDMIAILTEKFPDHEVVSELDVGPHVNTAGGWANRVCQLLVPFFNECEDGHFRFEAGVTTVAGTVKSEQTKMALHRHVGYVMEALDAKGIENNLKVEK